MPGLRRTTDTRKATDSLARLTLRTRTVQLLDSSAPAATVGRRGKTAVSAAAATRDAAADAFTSSAGKTAATGDDSSQQAADRARDVFAEATTKTAKATTGGAVRLVRGGVKLTGKVLKGGIIAARRRAAAEKAAVAPKVAADSAACLGRGGALASRASAAAVSVVRAIVAAIASVATSTPVLAMVAGVVIAVIAVLSVVSWLPGITTSEADEKELFHTGFFAIEDDYPFKGNGYTTPNPLSGYYYGNCTDFVWWRINRDAGVSAEEARSGGAVYVHADLTPLGGNGNEWGHEGNLPGWQDTRHPVPGDIISISQKGVLGSTTAAPGHVAYVGAVDDSGNVTIENYGNDNYYIRTHTISELNAWQDSGAIVIKHNPAGRAGGSTDEPSGDAQTYASNQLETVFGSGIDRDAQWQCLYNLWMGESGWNHLAENSSSGAYGIPQSLPGNKMASAGADWRTNPLTQVDWGLAYIRDRYGTPCEAWSFWQSRNPHWY